ncbi:hypothetical protein HCN44_001593 [Aphidius gifuensis]|uniref:Uncharacterized protein n=1 Tax=Aphidius gifuensis TaxID=684658 RepID=A0A835CSH1_APHGI|nr:hypothetical protein HCN44_001593 [Aphidius gifuensis]
MNKNQDVDKTTKQKIYPNDFERIRFEISIKDSNESIRRLTDRNEQLMSMIEETKQQIESHNIESKNTIADMNSELNLTLDKLHDHRKSADIIERQRIDNRDKHNNKMNLLQEKYENHRKIELSKIKIITGKIYALENYKKVQQELNNKLNDNDNVMIKNDEQLTERLIQIDQKLKLDEQKLYQNLRKNIYDIFKLDQARCSKGNQAVKRLFRENVNIRNELEQIEIDKKSKKN